MEPKQASVPKKAPPPSHEMVDTSSDDESPDNRWPLMGPKPPLQSAAPPVKRPPPKLQQDNQPACKKNLLAAPVGGHTKGKPPPPYLGKPPPACLLLPPPPATQGETGSSLDPRTPTADNKVHLGHAHYISEVGQLHAQDRLPPVPEAGGVMYPVANPMSTMRAGDDLDSCSFGTLACELRMENAFEEYLAESGDYLLTHECFFCIDKSVGTCYRCDKRVCCWHALWNVHKNTCVPLEEGADTFPSDGCGNCLIHCFGDEVIWAPMNHAPVVDLYRHGWAYLPNSERSVWRPRGGMTYLWDAAPVLPEVHAYLDTGRYQDVYIFCNLFLTDVKVLYQFKDHHGRYLMPWEHEGFNNEREAKLLLDSYVGNVDILKWYGARVDPLTQSPYDRVPDGLLNHLTEHGEFSTQWTLWVPGTKWLCWFGARHTKAPVQQTTLTGLGARPTIMNTSPMPSTVCCGKQMVLS